MLNQLIAKINEEITANNYEPHSFEWNVANQLIDVVTVQPSCAEIVMQDLSVEAMSIKKMAQAVIAKNLRNPVAIMKAICDFYKIPTPARLPPEIWQLLEGDCDWVIPEKPSAKSIADVDFMDLFGGV